MPRGRPRKTEIEESGEDFDAPPVFITQSDNRVKHGPCMIAGCTQPGNKWKGDSDFLCTQHRKDGGWLKVFPMGQS